jgi:hypothetical protein
MARLPFVRLLQRAALAAALVGAGGCGFWFLETRTAPVAAERRAPPFVLPDHTGAPVSLERLLERGPVVVVFYRGFW